jgi:phage-Barnase-EndoU-ColicinE5/D-RelE like nuclease3
MWKHTGHQTFDFGLLASGEVKKLYTETGLDFSGFRRIMATRGVRHALNNHGNALHEERYDQIAVRPDDFAKLPLIAADGIARLVGTTGGRKPARLEHRATFNDRVYVVLETIGIRERRLELWSTRIERVEKGNG